MKIIASMVLGLKAHHSLLTNALHAVKTCSDGTDVAVTQRTFLSSKDKDI